MSSDTRENMSPGKKAPVLLKLLFELVDNDCPLRIDQPEGDLDNRSVYNSRLEFTAAKKQKSMTNITYRR
jgi:hypothetical protein